MSGWPIGEYLTIGLWFDRPVNPSGLVVFGDVLEAEGARYGGRLFTAPAGVPFSWIQGIEGLDWQDGLSVEQIKQAMREGTAYRVNIYLPGLEWAILEVEGMPEVAVPSQHPVSLAFAAGALAVHPSDRDDEDRVEAAQMEPHILRYLKALCRHLDPAYAMLYGDGIMACTPSALAAGEEILGGDFFVSRRLSVRAPLDAHLAEMARVVTETVEWETGTLYCGNYLGDAPNWPALREKGAAVGLALGQLLAPA